MLFTVYDFKNVAIVRAIESALGIPHVNVKEFPSKRRTEATAEVPDAMTGPGLSFVTMGYRRSGA